MSTPDVHVQVYRGRIRFPEPDGRRSDVRLGAACTAVARLLAQPPQRGTVLGIVQGAVYVAVPTCRDTPVVALVAPNAFRPPNAVVLDDFTGRSPFAALREDDPALVGQGQIAVGPLTVRVARSWTPRSARPPATAETLRTGLAALTSGLDEAAEPVDPVLKEAGDALVNATSQLDTRAADTALSGLLGYGLGLTPAGDDLTAAFLVTLRQIVSPSWLGSSPGSPSAQSVTTFTNALARLVRRRAGRATTTLSCALLLHAARGEAIDEVADVLDAAGGRGEPMDESLRRLLAIGHSSGIELARGIQAGCEALLRLAGAGSSGTDAPRADEPAWQVYDGDTGPRFTNG